MALPAILLIGIGSALLLWLTAGPQFVGAIRLDVHMMIFGAMCVMVGYQIAALWIFAEMFGSHTRIVPHTPFMMKLRKFYTLERGMIIGLSQFVIGFGLGAYLLWFWYKTGFGLLNIEVTLRYAIWSLLLIGLGIQTMCSSFFYSFLMLTLSSSDDDEG